MVNRRFKAQVSFGLLIELAIGAVIVLYAADIMLKNYFKAPIVSRQEQNMLQQEGLADNETAASLASPAASIASTPEPGATPAGHYRSSIDNYKKMLDKVQQKQADSMKALEEAQ